MWRSLILAVSLLLPVAAPGQEVAVVQNTSGHDFDEAVASELYRRVLHQMEGRRLDVGGRPNLSLHLLPKKDVEQALRDCVRGGCGHVIRLGTVDGKAKRLIFIGISRERVDVWMDGPSERSLAQAIAASLDYENRLYLDPDRLDDIAFTAWTVARGERQWKVSVQALRAGQ